MFHPIRNTTLVIILIISSSCSTFTLESPETKLYECPSCAKVDKSHCQINLKPQKQVNDSKKAPSPCKTQIAGFKTDSKSIKETIHSSLYGFSWGDRHVFKKDTSGFSKVNVSTNGVYLLASLLSIGLYVPYDVQYWPLQKDILMPPANLDLLNNL